MTGRLAAATDHLRAGRLDEAQRLYEEVLQADSRCADAWQFLGLIALTRGDAPRAIENIRRAIALDNRPGVYHFNLALAQKQAGDLPAAIASYRAAIARAPALPEAHNNLGTALREAGELEEAAASCNRAIALRPAYVEAHINLSLVFHEQGNLEKAEATARRAVVLAPTSGAARLRLAQLLLALERLDDAIAELKHPSVGADASPGADKLFSAVAYACQQRERNADAAEWYGRALASDPGNAAMHFNRGLALQKAGQPIAAAESYRAALRVDAKLTEARKNLAIILLIFGRHAEVLALYHAGTGAAPDEPEFQRLAVTASFYDPRLSDADRFGEARRFAELHAPKQLRSIELTNVPDPDRVLRIGYVTSDFRDHPIGRNVEPLLAFHDPSQFELYAYSDDRRADAFTAHLQAHCKAWRSIGDMSDDSLAAQIVADRIDVLVVLAGHFDENRPLLLARRLAPVQVSFHDATTSALPEADYLIADRAVHPRGGSEQFTERVLHVPSIYTRAPLAEAPAVGRRVTGDHIAFGSFANPAKLNEQVFAAWARILAGVPASGLVLKYQHWFSTADLQTHVRSIFARHEIAPDRITFLGGTASLAEHLATYHQLDIALDPFPFCGSMGTFEALWMGVPVVSLCGSNMMGRWSASMLRLVGLDDLVAGDVDGYVETAIALANDPGRLAELRASLRERVARSPMVDGRLRARQTERLYRAAWRRWCAGRR